MPPATEAGKRRCKSCAEWLAPSGFYRNKAKKDGLESTCKECTIERVRQYRIANKDKVYARLAEYAKTYDRNTPERKAKRSAASSKYWRLQQALKPPKPKRGTRVRQEMAYAADGGGR